MVQVVLYRYLQHINSFWKNGEFYMSKKKIVYLLLDIIFIVVSLSLALLKEPMCALFAIAPMCSIYIILVNRKKENTKKL